MFKIVNVLVLLVLYFYPIKLFAMGAELLCRSAAEKVFLSFFATDIQYEDRHVRLASALKADLRLVKEAEFATKDVQIQKDINKLIEKEIIGDESSASGYGRFSIGNGYYELRSRHGARVYIRVIRLNGIKHVVICGKATKKGTGNFRRVINIMESVFPDFPPPVKNVNVKKK